MRHFEYFNDPLHFAFLAEPGVPCDCCGGREVNFDGGGFCGERDVTATCPACLASGKLLELDVTTNELTPRLREDSSSQRPDPAAVITVQHCTPQLPTWQDSIWPVVDGELPKFIKLASQVDFVDKQELLHAVPEAERFGRDAEELWEMLPASPITSLRDGNFDTSFYLFASAQGKFCTWDCN